MAAGVDRAAIVANTSLGIVNSKVARAHGATDRAGADKTDKAEKWLTQPFLDGNKRLALVAMLTFLEANGHQINATDPELADWIIQLSADLTPEQLAECIGQRLIPATPR